MSYKVAFKQEKYQTYILSDEKTQSRVEIVPQRGGIVSNWRIQGQDIFYLDKERFQDPSLTVRGGIPILFPNCGKLEEDIFKFNKNYKLKQHGFARNLPWEVTDKGTENCASLTIFLKSNDKTKAVYPFDFEITFTYELEGKTLRIKQIYTNKSKQIMPFSVGFHPYFWVRNKSQVVFDIPSNWYRPKGSKEFVRFNGHFDFSREEININFTNLSRNSASFKDPQRKLNVQINYTDMFNTLVLWTVKGKDFICLEPWSATRNALNTQENLIYLYPGKSCEGKIEIVIS